MLFERPIVGATICAAAAAALVVAASPVRAEVDVVVTVKPAHSLVAGVMEGEGSPRLLIDGAGSPHTFAIKPSDARALSKARLVVRVSEGLETFLERTLKGLPATARVLSLDGAAGIRLLALREGGPFEPHAHGGKGHDDHDHATSGPKGRGGEGMDGHLWLDPDNARAIVDAVAAALAELDPPAAAHYRANAARMKGEIAALADEIAAAVRPLADRPIIVFHDAYQYFERRFGLSVVGSITVNPDVQPSARRLSELRRRIAARGAVCVFAEPQFEPGLIRAVTEGTKARPGVLDPLGAAIPAGPGLYATLLRNLARDLKRCLEPG